MITELIQNEWLNEPWLVVIGGTVLAATTLFVLKFIIIYCLKKWTQRTDFVFDSLLVDSLSTPLTLCTMMVLVIIFGQLLNTTGFMAEHPLPIAATAKAICIFALVLFLDHFLFGTVDYYSARSVVVSNSHSIIKGLIRCAIVCVGLLVLLGTLGISITPIIASLGITSLAVALALQPTLENFFSGVQLVIDKPIRVGDFIELESGDQGFVEKIGWRSTWVKMLPNNMIVIPNSQLSKSRIINYFYPEKELSVPVEVGVHYSSDLEKVEQVTLDVARQILKSHEWGVDDYETFVVFHTFDQSSINFTVMLRAKEYFNRFWVKSAFIKALHQRYAEEGIVIPYPIRAINTSQESAQFKQAD
ncbi:mechanosensitive ion channel family protein [Pseudoalteromonas shioyasakiensis]|uniref:Small-conductance mechanosensitive channel n=1 Tax=Pseudoalteromonas shioyasakiensis TaxID=1190813 RepID=A0ABT6TXY3_9GAMM|nr:MULTISPECIES: mechanosensitive ion channel family protein [Pseudoalteromonas]MDI4668746.1 mechanosensitive ion channel family protein [Pseudoalteromonas shioyasakiensis]MDI4673871.1 mechanosensitive ion channel family protein [Pseudoalteromonas shioyasakiensis]MDI4685580.1 mechanosensitive ion channel family protein [Pseudoalteromonas shioyasakiensis]MDI4703948.1 mechanosensitive ion channel family protein [Pseudoalteromonas shioyasakiensis]NUJ20993.1 mechanosensitive ion channel family pro